MHPVDDIEQGETQREEVPGILTCILKYSGIRLVFWYFVWYSQIFRFFLWYSGKF